MSDETRLDRSRQWFDAARSIAKLMINLPQDNQLDDLEPIRLDKFYILTRYPESLPEGASIRQIFGRRDAEDGYATASGTAHLLPGGAKELGVTIPELNEGILPRE